MEKQRINYYKRLAQQMGSAQVETERAFHAYYKGMITAEEQEKMLAMIIKTNINNALIISSMFSVIAARPTHSNYTETIQTIFNNSLRAHVERLEQIRMERELEELKEQLVN